MKKNIAKIFSFVMVSLTLSLLFPSDAFAGSENGFYAENIVRDSAISPRLPIITSAGIGVQKTNDGMLIEFATSSNVTASVIGVKNIVIQEKVWYGWKTVYTSNGGESADRMLAGYTILYTEAKEGTTYKISCTHYANTGTYEEVENSKEYKF